MEGHGTKSDTMPDVHTMAAALAYARQGEDDIGPDIALAIVCQTDYRRQRIVTELAAALLAATGKVGERSAQLLPMICGRANVAVVLGVQAKPDPAWTIAERDWLLLAGLAEAMLMQAAEGAIRRAAGSYHGRDVHKHVDRLTSQSADRQNSL
ncbi:hypothetical protein XOC_2766 [Xanthomonas oryzae pv. oryzicola BLS256]|uniref:Uncharacterized protein n=2 Tax=Xanthomonas oryzae TaxID=347 RepID=G7TJ55_XANOB|nr:hypothetical protein XOC_2766 [Xanthomonas oryzae pv. oryzicola BLS256]